MFIMGCCLLTVHFDKGRYTRSLFRRHFLLKIWTCRLNTQTDGNICLPILQVFGIGIITHFVSVKISVTVTNFNRLIKVSGYGLNPYPELTAISLFIFYIYLYSTGESTDLGTKYRTSSQQ